MSKGSNRRKEDIKKIWNNWEEINWDSAKKNIVTQPFYPCPICGSEENKPTEFKHFVVDAGINHEYNERPSFIRKKIQRSGKI